TLTWARGKADTLKHKFEGDWWDSNQGLYADSLALDHAVLVDQNATVVTAHPINKLQQLYWINATPMETNIAESDHASTAFPTLEGPIFTGNTGFFQQGKSGSIKGSRQ